MNGWQILFIALLLDYIFGEPDRLWQRYPHPAVLMGRVVHFLDQKMNRSGVAFASGFFAVALMTIGAIALGWIISLIPDFGILEVIVVAILLAHRSLIDHVRAVADGLETDLIEGRKAVALIVGRDPNRLTESGVASAAIESAAENFSDGVIAPAFWFLVLGLPGLLLYKIINTADSMIGHRTERHAQFGYAAAKFDDILNYIPARLTGGLMCLVYKSRDALTLMQSEAPLHRSPNAGWPEAAMAALLNVRLSGPRFYPEGPSDDAYINPMGTKELTPDHIRQSLQILDRSWTALTGLVGLGAALLWIL